MMKKVVYVLYFSFAFIAFSLFGSQTTAQSYTERAYVTGYGEVTVVDPAVPKIVGHIKVKGPARDLTFTEDGKKGLVSANGRTTLYVFDTVQNKVLDEINLVGRTDKGMLDRRVWGSAISPDGSKAYAFITQGEKQTNLYKTLPSKILEIDLKTKEVTRTLEAPYGIHMLQFKEGDPKTLFVWGYDLYTLNTDTWKLEKKLGIKNKDNPKDGSTNILFLFPRGAGNSASHYNSVPTVTTYPDGRVTEGIAWFNVKTGEYKSTEFDKPPVGMFSAVVDPEVKYGYSIMNHWYKTDLKTGHVLKDAKPPTGTIYGINMSADGKKLYLAGGGNDFIIANTDLQVEKTIKMPTDGWDIKVNRIQN
jgi:DNA-binding beta-propeller fold protein YncE